MKKLGNKMNNKNNSKTDSTHVIDPKAIGVEVSWSFGDGDALAVKIPRHIARTIFSDHGFDPDLIEDTDAPSAIATASRVVKGRTKRIVVKEMKRKRDDTSKAFAIYSVQSVEGESGDDLVCGARVRVEHDRIVCRTPEGDPVGLPECIQVGDGFADNANEIIDNAINGDISKALLGIGWSQGWISRRRNKGGVYMLANTQRAARFVELLQALQAATAHHRINNQFMAAPSEVYAKPLSVSTWKQATQVQFADKTDALLKDLALMQRDDKMRDKTVQQHADACDALLAQAEQHKLLLADNLASVTAELAKIKTAFEKRLAGTQADGEAVFADVPAPVAAKRKRVSKRRAVKKAVAPVQPDAADISEDVTDLFG